MSEPRTGRNPNIDDVARAAGVSRATVSRVMNGKATVDATLTERVLQAAATLRYQPSTTARSLSLGRTNTVAVAVPDLTNPMFQDVLRGVSDAAATRGYQVLVANTGGDPGAELAGISDARRRCDAIVLVSPRLQEPSLRALLPTLEPVVVVNRLPDGVTPTIGVDYAAGADQLVEHLLALGHRHLVYLAGPPLSESNGTRVEALRRVATRTGVELTEIDAGASIESGYRAGEAVLRSHATAVVAYNDLVAFGLLARLNELGVAVPADISVAGFDNITLARFAVPPLTTVAIPHTQLGALAWEQLTELLDGVGRSDPPLWRPTLIARASTGVVPATVAGMRIDQATDGDAAPGPQLTGVVWRTVTGEGVPERALVGTLADGGELELCRTEAGDAMPPVHSPRPYLHPVRTASGVDLTDVTPADHRHHYGVSMAVALVNGTSFWGGRTYVRDEGPTLLANHGRQRVIAEEAEGAALRQRIGWDDRDGVEILTEDRTVEAGVLEGGWALRWRSELHAGDGDLLIESPATSGRQGAGYGGIFWRLGPATTTTVLAAHGEGADAVHGSLSPWVALVQHRGTRAATLVLAQRPDAVRPWFLRASDYPGAGPALAWDRPLVIPAGETLVVALGAALIDGALDADGAAAAAEAIW